MPMIVRRLACAKKGDKGVSCLLISPPVVHSHPRPGPIGLHIFLTWFTGDFHRRPGYCQAGLGSRSVPSHPAPQGAGRGRAPSTESRPAPMAPRAAQAADRLQNVQQIPDEYAWMLRACCRGANTREFFPSNGLGVEAAQRICRTCPVREECLEYALQHHIEQGVWGGASERERRRILRQRRRAGAVQS